MPPTSVPIALRLMRAWFGVASHVLPGVAERQAARLFLRPRRRPARPATLLGVEPRAMQVEIDGERLAGWSWGDDEAPTVLLVHGWSGRAADMEAIAARLAREGGRAIAFDMPAHGESAGRQTSLAVWTRLLPRIAAHFGTLDTVVGHSFGGAAVVLALGAGLDARRVVLVAPAAGPAHFIDQMRRMIGLHERRVPGMTRHLVTMVGAALEEFDSGAVAAGLPQPALILHDPLDREVPFAHGEAIAGAWRGSILVPMPGAGHTRILRSPELLERVAAFVAVVNRREDTEGHGG